MSHLIQDSIRDGSLVLYHDYRAGHALDLSGNGNHGTLGGADARFDRNGFVNGYYGSGYVTVPHSASINLTTLTVVMLIVPKRITQYTTGTRLFSKGSVATRVIDVYEAATGQIVQDTAGTDCNWPLVREFSGIQCYGINLANNTITPIYLDGIFDTNANTGPTVGTNTDSLHVGNISGLSRGFGRTISSFLMWNRLLTADEHRQAYLELLK